MYYLFSFIVLLKWGKYIIKLKALTVFFEIDSDHVNFKFIWRVSSQRPNLLRLMFAIGKVPMFNTCSEKPSPRENLWRLLQIISTWTHTNWLSEGKIIKGLKKKGEHIKSNLLMIEAKINELENELSQWIKTII